MSEQTEAWSLADCVILRCMELGLSIQPWQMDVIARIYNTEDEA